MIPQSPSEARGLRYQKWPFAKRQYSVLGGLGGFPPHSRDALHPGGVRGGLGGFTPHSRREFHPGDEGGFGGFPPIREADFHAGKIAGGSAAP